MAKTRAPAKPRQGRESAFMSAKWDEICKGRTFRTQDIPALTLLVQWYAVVERCISDMDVGDGLPQVAYENKMGDVKAVPMIQTMKQAYVVGGGADAGKDSVLRLVSQSRKQRAAR